MSSGFDRDALLDAFDRIGFSSPAEFASRNIFTEEPPSSRTRPVSILTTGYHDHRHRRTGGIRQGYAGKRLAHHYGYRHLDTGVIYRAVAKALLDQGHDLTDEARAVAVAMELDPEKFGHPKLKTQRIGDAASVVSAIASVREALVSFQRQFAADPAGRRAGRA